MTPALVILAGLPGAGKSTLAAALWARLGWSVVDRDRIRAAMFIPCASTEAEKDAAGEAAWLAVETLLERGRSCIVDGMTFAAARARHRAREVAELAGARFVALVLVCPPAVAVARVRGQTHAAGDRDAELVRAVAARFEPPEPDCVTLDATQPPAEVLRRALEVLGVSPAPASPDAR